MLHSFEQRQKEHRKYNPKVKTAKSNILMRREDKPWKRTIATKPTSVRDILRNVRIENFRTTNYYVQLPKHKNSVNEVLSVVKEILCHTTELVRNERGV